MAEAKRCLNCAICSECMECVRACGPGALLHGERDEELDSRGRRRRDGHRLRPVRPGEQERVRLPPLPQRALGARVRAHAQRLRPHRGRGQAPVTTARTPRTSPSSSASARATRSTSTAPACAACSPTSRPCSPSTTCPTASPPCSSWTCAPRARASTPSTSAPSTRACSFVRSRPSSIKEDPLTSDLLISWEDEQGKLHQTRFDMVVLSVGLEPARKAQEAAGHLGIALNRHGFCQLQSSTRSDQPRGRVRRGSVQRAQGHPRLGRRRPPRPRPRS